MGSKLLPKNPARSYSLIQEILIFEEHPEITVVERAGIPGTALQLNNGGQIFATSWTQNSLFSGVAD